ncbi:MAG TPA: nuclease-related domain-containing protein [Bacillales bacterium]|nr:nuclease-related domain-containing protein [Bacillales bacterium]
MAQLIKLENYISRYEHDIYRYPGKFIQMKKKRWEVVKEGYDKAAGEGGSLKSLETLKHEFVEDVYFFQLRWASSTLKAKSDLDSRYKFDSWLKFYLLKFPDNYLILYKPVFQFRQAPVELDIIIISPMAVWCVTLQEGEDGGVFQGDSSRFWRKVEGEEVRKVLSPMVSNHRTFRLVSQLLEQYMPEPLPVRRVILSPSSFIEFPDAPASVEIIDRRRARGWYEGMKKQASPLKFVQLKTAGLLLDHCQTIAFER